MASDYILEIPGIKGESADKQFKGHIDIQSYSFGGSNSGSASIGGGAGAGKVSYQDITFTKQWDLASPILMEHMSTGKHLDKAILHVRKQSSEGGGSQMEYLTVTMTDFIISHYSSSGHEGSGNGSDSFSLNFAKVKIEYKAQTDKGGKGSGAGFEWDLKQNVKTFSA
jgi:type VI secretion system secreted protein Hcp